MKLNFMFLMMVVMLGLSLYRNFNFNTLEFKPFWVSMLQLVVFIVALILMVKRKK